MTGHIDQGERYVKMTTEAVPRLVSSLAVPTIVSMLITALYNMADTFYVSKISTSASGAVGVVFSLMAIIQAIGFTFGMGSGTHISRLFGQRENERASQASSTAFFLAIASGLLLMIFGLLFLDPLMRLLGATPTILPFARDYARYILIGAPYMTAAFVMNNNLRSEGTAVLSMVGIGAGAILNIVLDPIFIFTFDMGISGAAIATIISQFVSFLVLLSHFVSGRSNIRLSVKNVRLEKSMCCEILRLGLPTFFRQSFASAAAIFMNWYAGPFGDAAVAGMSITTRIVMFVNSALIGFGQGFQPVSGFNYGAGFFGRVAEAYKFCVKVGVAVFCVFAAVGLLFAPEILMVFRREDPEVVAIGARALRFMCVILPLQPFIVLTNMLSQSIGKSREASMLALCRQGLFFIPTIALLSRMIGLLGVQLAQPTADFLTFFLALPISVKILRELSKKNPPVNAPADPYIPVQEDL